MTAELAGCPLAALSRDGDRWAGDGVAVVRHGGRLHAFADTCPHGAASLVDAPVRDGVVTCPRHGARFRLSDGKALSGPTRTPLPCFDVDGADLRPRRPEHRRSVRRLIADVLRRSGGGLAPRAGASRPT